MYTVLGGDLTTFFLQCLLDTSWPTLETDTRSHMAWGVEWGVGGGEGA